MSTPAPKISVIIVSYNRKDDLRLAIEALLGCRYEPLEIVVVDNDSRDGSADEAARHAGVRVIRNAHNVGFAEGNNIGLGACAGEYVALINNDAVVEPTWLHGLVSFLERHPDAAAAGGKMYLWDDDNPLGCRDNRYYGYTTVDLDMGYTHATMDVPDAVREVATLSGAAVMLRRAAIDDVGEPFLEPIFFTYYEETDFFARALRRGYKLYYVGEPAVWHRIRAGGKPYGYFYHMERNRLLYVARHFESARLRLVFGDAASRAASIMISAKGLWSLVRPSLDDSVALRAQLDAWAWLLRNGRLVARQREHEMSFQGPSYDECVRALQARSAYYHHDRPEVRALIPEEAQRVLDVGCAAGALGAALKRERPAIEVRGVECDPRAFALARAVLDLVSPCSAEQGLPDGWEPPDCVVFADVLEHLADPWTALRTWHDALAPGGTVVISLPNVAHYSVAFDLALGIWNYADAGVLDRTHLRFFTRETAIRMVEAAGFRALRVERCLQVPDTEAHRRLLPRITRWTETEGARRALGGVRQQVADLCTVQYLIVARKDEDPTNGRSATQSEARPHPSNRSPRAAVSVVIANYNYGAYLGSAIESALRQTEPPLEVLVVDDGSSDDSEEVAARYRVPFLRQRHEGVSVARNHGARVARGNLLLFLDADDVLESNYIAACTRALSRAPRSVAYAYTSMRYFGQEREIFEAPHFDAEALCKTNFVHVSALLRREAFEHAGGFNPQWRLGHEDYELWIRLLAHGYTGRYVPDTVLHYRRHGRTRNMHTDEQVEQLYWSLRLAFPRLYWRTLARHPTLAARWYRALMARSDRTVPSAHRGAGA